MSTTDGDPLSGSPQQGSRPDAPDVSAYGSGPIPPGAFAPPPQTPQLGRYSLASWGSRLAAWIIDALIVLAILGAIVWPLIVFAGLSGGSTSGVIGVILAGLLGALVFFVASLLYAPLLMARWNGQTVGKRALGIRVVRVDGRPIDFGAAFVRESLVKGLLNAAIGALTFALLPLIDYLWPLWDAENRALHDFLCATRVVSSDLAAPGATP